jgi:hypothetical protein
MSASTRFAGLLLATAVLGTASLPARAEVRMPAPSQPSTPEGYWKSQTTLYGKYRLSFDVNSNGTGSYMVRAGGLTCHAELTWTKGGFGYYDFTMRRANCGNGTDWTADRFACRVKPAKQDGLQIRMPVPTVERELDCIYKPAVAGYGWAGFKASRG